MMMVTDEMLKLRQFCEKEEKNEMLTVIKSNWSSPLSLQIDLPDDRLRHVLILPRATVHLLELDTMQTKQRDLDDEDLESQSHAGA
jgi:hypothetical protein